MTDRHSDADWDPTRVPSASDETHYDPTSYQQEDSRVRYYRNLPPDVLQAAIAGLREHPELWQRDEQLAIAVAESRQRATMALVRDVVPIGSAVFSVDRVLLGEFRGQAYKDAESFRVFSGEKGRFVPVTAAEAYEEGVLRLNITHADFEGLVVTLV